VFPFDTDKDGLRLANASDYGLASYLFAGDLRRTLRAARGIEAGMVGVNTGLISNAANPFGGIKQSGFGREGSRHGLDDYMQLKAVTLAGVG
jgi:succinate-semialdehyde dehydrogenase/glutarate-semialdehyde dehydrogenase